ncbi:PepSY domain-containing protein, partial [Shewanella sp. AC91-MNA-CIBAN-0169]|uniref:PepSY domain-containing protein n=1 Tax=Shewanella sp. AC91-MNA-CIBAN-0169 TaxID=3140466 RepID=UPI0033286AB6
VEIDANSGKILRTKQEKLDAEDVAEYSVMKQSKLSLLQAMKRATQTVNGKVISADFDVKNSRPVYDIEILKGTQEYDIVIDGITGRV